MAIEIPPDDYGDVQAEYAALRRGAALFDLSSAGKLHLSGKNAVPFLNGLVSNDVKKLPAGEGVFAAFPNGQGKVAALCRIYNTGVYLLLELDASTRAKIHQNLSRFVLAGDFFVTDASEQQALLSLQGPQAAALLAALTEQPLNAATPYQISERAIAHAPVFIATHSRTGETGFDIFVAAEAAPRVCEAILTRGAEFGARWAGRTVLETARIEAAIPHEPVDVNENYILLETNLHETVSYTKGCYLGQEVIARIHWRGQPAKQLKGLLIEAAAPPPQGTELWASDGRKVGEITSSTHSLALNRLIALGYVHRYYLAAGTEFTLNQGAVESGRAQVAETPFVTVES